MQHKREILRILAAAILFSAALIWSPENVYIELTLYVAAFLVAGGGVLLRAVQNLLRGQVFDENFLMTLAAIGAFLIGEYPEGVAVMLFYQIGELFEHYAVGRSRKSISDLMDIRADYANVRRGEEILTVDPGEVKVGEWIIVKPGERVPLDGKVVEGSSMVDTSALTGESVPREVLPGSDVLSGCINMNGLLTMKVTKEYEDSTVARILDLVENSLVKKSKSEAFITRFARYYTPVVVIVAALLAVLPPMISGWQTFGEWVSRSLVFLVISCPCALVISVPLGFFGGIGGASRQGILVKGSNYLEALAHSEIVVLDKTGTLTKGVFNVQEVVPVGRSADQLLEIAVLAESFSNHPISQSLRQAYQGAIDPARVTETEEIPGFGVRAMVDGAEILAGNAKLMEKYGVTYTPADAVGTLVYIAADGRSLGYIRIADEVKEDALSAIAALKALKVQKTVMLTGDSARAGTAVAGELGIDQVYTDLLPEDKVTQVEALYAQKSPAGKLVYVGDGINDAPVLARADIGIAMGGLGSDAAIEAADVVIMTDEPSKIADAIRISRKTLVIVKQNIVFSLGVKAVVLILAAVGIANMWAGVFADVGVSILAILNAMRALKILHKQGESAAN